MSLYSGSYEITQRQGMIALGTSIYLRLEGNIEQLKDSLLANLTNNDEKEAIINSFEKLRAIAQTLRGDESYIKSEKPFIFKDYLEDLKNVLKIVYLGIRQGRRTEGNPPDHIDYHKKAFFEALERIRGSRILCSYTPITQVVRFLRNMEEHADKPIDDITGKKSYGNLYTLVSVFILVTYAYREILQVWLDTIKQVRPTP